MHTIQQNVPLKDLSNYKIGGPARLFAEVSSVEELKEILRSTPTFAKASAGRQDKIAILGGGTNVLISDEGFDGLVIHNKIEGINILEDGIEVGSGVLIKDLLNFCIDNSLSGLEWAGGLPGTLGGAIRGNAGAFKGEIKDSIAQVKSLKLKVQSEITRNNEECKFAYRNSVFKSGEGEDEFITSAVFSLKPGNKEEVRQKIQEKIDYRINRHPMDIPSIGSTFKNIPVVSLSENLQKEFAEFVKTDPFPVIPTTKLLALCDLKGKRAGGAMISEKHPNFIVNINNATAKDVKALIEIAKNSVKEKYGINLEEEIKYLD